MTVFGPYARFYDLLYRDKDYAGEAAFTAAKLRGLVPGAERLLELGSGTGAHAIELARLGFDVSGVDLSADMVVRAEARRVALPPGLAARVRFAQGDARSWRVDGRFDAVVSLFHVVSYQTGDADVAGMLETAAANLGAGGAFFFDFWYGPAVLAERPEVRVKRLQDAELELSRLAEPTLREDLKRVDVRYTLTGRRRADGAALAPVVETHSMRYFFLPELEAALVRAGFELASACEMATGAPLTERTWSACALARRR